MNMKKLSIFVQWLVVAGLAGFVAYTIARPAPQPEYRPETWNTWTGFHAISYAGVSRHDNDPMYPTTRRIGEQLAALRAAGYRTVRPEDVEAFLAGRAPLPEKALLIVFEGGRKEAFIRATPLLQRNGFAATIVVPTVYTKMWTSFFLKKKDLPRVLHLPQWSVGGMGHEAFADIPVDASGATGHFLTRRRWADGAPESPDAYRQRVLGDYSRSADILREGAGRAPLLYLYPYADAGTGAEADPLAEEVNRIGVMRHYRLAFTRSDTSFNGRHEDPFALGRLRVSGSWDGARLVRELERRAPNRSAVAGLEPADAWRLDGPAVWRGGELDLLPGGAVWRIGTENWHDVELSAGFQVETAGVGAVYVRYAGPRSFLRVALEPGGLRVQERLESHLQTLAWKPGAGAGTETRNVRIRVRNNRAWVWLNDAPVAGPLPLSPSTRQGRVGLGSESGPVTVTAFTARPADGLWALADRLADLPDPVRNEVAGFLPAWIRAGEKPDLGGDRNADLLAAAGAGIEVRPRIADVAALSPAAADDFARTLDDALAGAGAKPFVRGFVLEGAGVALADALRRYGYRITHRVTPAEARGIASSLSALGHDDDILLRGAAPAEVRAFASELLHTFPASGLHLPAPAPAGAPAGAEWAVSAEDLDDERKSE